MLIGGPGASLHYTSANGSIAGNGPRNPFLAGIATFTLNITGVTTTSVSGVNFSFGTAAGDNVPGVQVTDGGTTALLLGAALAGIGWFRRKRSFSLAGALSPGGAFLVAMGEVRSLTAML